MEHEIFQALLHNIERHPKGSESEGWFIRLIQDSLNGTTSPEIDADLFYNATVVENLIANLLAIDIKIIVKVRMMHKIINTLWEENNWDITLLNSYILDDKPILQNILLNNIEKTNTIPNNETISTPIEELPSQEIEMTENDCTSPQSTTPTMSVEIQSTSQIPTNLETTDDNTPMDLIGQDITEVSHYDIRNRTLNPLNPYFITKNKTYLLGILAINTPGDNNREQKAFIANSLKLPFENDLIQLTFWKGNNWFTIGFDYEEDLIFCKDKLNTKEKDLIKFIQLSPKTKDGKKEEENNISINKICNNNGKKLPSTSSPTKTTKEITKKDETVIQNPSKLISNQSSYEGGFSKEKETNIQNPYKLIPGQSQYRGGFLTAKFPGENRLEQFNNAAKILQISPLNNLITHSFLQSNSWLTISFHNQENLDHCIETINKLENSDIRLIDLTKKKKKEQPTIKNNQPQENNGKEKAEKSNHQQVRSYTLTDIPVEFDNKRIKGALRPFGKIQELQIDQKRKWKSATFTIQQQTQSYSLENRWSIPLGNDMARIAPKENFLQTLKERNNYSARLYGVPKQASTVVLFQELKHLKAKTCYIPKCTYSGKNRGFALISFESQQDLNKATQASARYQNIKLTWLKSNNQAKPVQTETSFTNTDSESQPFESYCPLIFKKKNENYLNKGKAKMSISTASSVSNPSYSEQPSQWKKSKSKKPTTVYKEGTSDKLISLITKLATRLDNIEEKLNYLPNRS